MPVGPGAAVAGISTSTDPTLRELVQKLRSEPWANAPDSPPRPTVIPTSPTTIPEPPVIAVGPASGVETGPASSAPTPISTPLPTSPPSASTPPPTPAPTPPPSPRERRSWPGATPAGSSGANSFPGSFPGSSLGPRPGQGSILDRHTTKFPLGGFSEGSGQGPNSGQPQRPNTVPAPPERPKIIDAKPVESKPSDPESPGEDEWPRRHGKLQGVGIALVFALLLESACSYKECRGAP